MTAETYNPPESLSGFQSKAMIAAAAGAVLAVVGFAMSGLDRFYEAYLVAWVFWTGVALGSLALLMVQHLSGGAWGVVIRRHPRSRHPHAAGDGGARSCRSSPAWATCITGRTPTWPPPTR